jgi:transcriptional activator SPT7
MEKNDKEGESKDCGTPGSIVSWTALVTDGFPQSERHRLIRGNKLNQEEAALLRSRTGMARNIRNMETHLKGTEDIPAVGGINGYAEEEDETLLPDYYTPLSCVPEIPWRVVWTSDGGEVGMPDENLRLAPRGMFVQPVSELTKKIDTNIKQIQDTRKLCSKIGVIKQMQVQTQVWQIGPVVKGCH